MYILAKELLFIIKFPEIENMQFQKIQLIAL